MSRWWQLVDEYPPQETRLGRFQQCRLYPDHQSTVEAERSRPMLDPLVPLWSSMARLWN